VLLESTVASGALTRDKEQVAARVWAGNRYVAWTSGDSYCVRVRFAARTPAGFTALTNALQKVANAAFNTNLQPGPQPVLTTCG
jgi:hypothetical protein